MKIDRFSFSGTAGNALEAYIWSPDSEPKVILQVTHGMTEHMGRYEKLAEELAAQGVVTAGFDLPGHGRNPGRPDCASFGEFGWIQTLADMCAGAFPGATAGIAWIFSGIVFSQRISG